MIEKIYILFKNVTKAFKINVLVYFIIKQIKIYNLNRKGDKLAYYLTHPEIHNFEHEINALLFSILSYAKENVPYYRRIMYNVKLDKNSIISNLKELPLLSKAMIRELGKNILSENFDKDFSYYKKTGGSTGEPLEFAVSKNFEHIHGRCLYKIMGAKKNDIIAAIDGTFIEQAKLDVKIFWTREGKDFPYGSVHYSALHMNEDNMKFYIDDLNSVKPSIMRGYPSGFECLAHYLLKNDITLGFTLTGIYLTAESFDFSSIELINAALKCPVYGQYGHSEVSIFAFTLANTLEYICSPVYGFTEVLDVNGNHVNEGETGEVVVTGFSNKVMPFIRYRTGDVAVYGGTHNGIVILNSLQGRTIDYILNRNNKKVYLLGLIFSKRLKSYKSIKQWQIEQNTIGEILVRIVKEDDFLKSDEHEMIRTFESFGVNATINYVDKIPLTMSGKRRLLVQNILI